jgi:hypothetical protein
MRFFSSLSNTTPQPLRWHIVPIFTEMLRSSSASMTGGAGATTIAAVDVGVLFALGPDVYTSLPAGVSVIVKFALDVDLGASI